MVVLELAVLLPGYLVYLPVNTASSMSYFS